MKKILDAALRKGVILGGVMVGMDLLNYWMMPQSYVSVYFRMVSLLIWLGVIIYWSWLERRFKEYYLLKDAFIFCLVIMSGAVIIESTYRLMLFQIIDPDLFDTFKKNTLDQIPNANNKMKAEISASIDKSYQPLGFMESLFHSILLYVFPALGIALLFRKKQPK